MHRAQVENREA